MDFDPGTRCVWVIGAGWNGAGHMFVMNVIIMERMCGRFVLFTTGDELLSEVATLPGINHVEAPDGTPEEALELVHPSRVADTLQWNEAAKEVGNVRNDYAELISG